MGCNNSKVERLPAVALCRERCKFLDDALQQSYALADAHVAHMHSLNTLPSSLLSFFHHLQPPNPPINDGKESPASHSHSSSCSSDDDSDDARVLLHSESEPQDLEKEIHFFTQIRHHDYVNHVDTVTVSSSAPLYAPFSPPLTSYYAGYSGSKPPSPPAPPRSSAWDFLHFFEPYDRYHAPYSQSREADVATTEEEKDKEGKVIISSSDTEEEPQNEAEKTKGDGRGVENREAGCSLEKEEAVASEELKAREGLCCERMKEIQILFERASASGNTILEMLDVGSLRYHRKYPEVSCKMMNVILSNLLAFKCMETTSLLGRRRGFGCKGVDKEDKGHGYGNLCSILKTLSMWEKKLYHEVKAEEKLRVLHQKKCRQLRRMNKKGADAQKVDSMKSFIGTLATKMKISIQVVDKISTTISKLREEELWPQISRLILMFLGLWKDMAECYRCQYQEIAEAKTFLDDSTFSMKLGNGKACIDAAIKLKSEIQNWNLSFSDWMHAQKCYVKSLNGWLVRCLLYEPEDATPFSPSKIGAPPVFVICNKWSRAVDKLSHKNVTGAVNGFMLRLNELLEKHILDLQQKSTTDKELERKVKMLEKQEQKMTKIVRARERKMVSVAGEETDALLRGDAVHHGDLVDNTVGLQSGLKQIFLAMERFTATSAGLYQELCQQINQDNGV